MNKHVKRLIEVDLPIKRSPEELKRFLARAPANILVKYRDPQSLASQIKQDLRQLPAEQWPETQAMAQSLLGNKKHHHSACSGTRFFLSYLCPL